MGKTYKQEPEHLRPVKVEHVADCEDCGRTDVLNRTVLIQKNETPYPHWRKHCKNCKWYEDPDTGIWRDISSNELNREMCMRATVAKKLAKLQEYDK